MPVHHADLLRLERGGAVQHMLHQRPARQRMQHLGLVGKHARAFAGSEDDDVQRVHVVVSEDGGLYPQPSSLLRYPRLIPGYVVDTTGGIFPESAIGKSFCVTPEYPENLALEFDLTAPINPQIERAKKMLVAQQKRNNQGKLIVKKAIVLLYPWYLRTLDALAAGAKHSEMIEIFSAQYQDAISDDTLRNWKKEAERLRDGGYAAQAHVKQLGLIGRQADLDVAQRLAPRQLRDRKSVV